MAIVINPDGTVSTIETTHDQYGNIKPKIDSELMKEQEIHYTKNTVSVSKYKKGYVYPTSSNSGESKDYSSSYATSRRRLNIKTSQIDNFFSKLISKGKWLGTNAYLRIKNRLPAKLQVYFASKYEKYREQIKKLEDIKLQTTFKIPKGKKKKKKNKNHHQGNEVKVHHYSHTGNTIGEIAKFGSLKEELASSSDYEVRTSNPPRPARPPKYAYARDRYGRVQERDSFNEEKRNEFYSAQNRQKHYDYSDYDANDDNDGAYSGWE